MLEIEFLLAPFVACLVIAGIHAYMGIHVIEREVIFVDLSLAQIATLGTACGLLVGFEYGGTQAYFLSLAFTFVGATIFSFSRTRDKRVPQEAIIGIVYAVSAAAFVLIMDRAPEGAEQIKGMLVGSILFVSWNEIINTAILYALLGVFHYAFQRKIILISQNPAQAFEEGISIRLWDFLFYMTFGLMVTASVAIAGVLLVFSYLVVPSVIAVLFTKKLSWRLGIGWLVSVLASLLGIIASLVFDMPTGAAIVCTFGLLLLISGFIARVRF
ncbi:MAG: metal ABC transporter permease [bacterium]